MYMVGRLAVDDPNFRKNFLGQIPAPKLDQAVLQGIQNRSLSDIFFVCLEVSQLWPIIVFRNPFPSTTKSQFSG